MKSVTLPLSASTEVLLKEAWEARELILMATKEINRLQERHDIIVEELLTHGVREAVNYQILEKQTVRRKINSERFRDLYPMEYGRIKELEISRFMESAGKNITLKDAEHLLGEDALNPVCDLQVTIKNVVVQRGIE